MTRVIGRVFLVEEGKYKEFGKLKEMNVDVDESVFVSVNAVPSTEPCKSADQKSADVPSGDLISREEAIQELQNCKELIQQDGQDYLDERDIPLLDMAIEALSAEAVQGWIPCSERLPSAEDCPMDCMVTRYSEQIGAYVDMAVCERDGTWTHEDWKAITIKGEATCISTMDADIIAWMPLPKPYREDGEGE